MWLLVVRCGFLILLDVGRCWLLLSVDERCCLSLCVAVLYARCCLVPVCCCLSLYVFVVCLLLVCCELLRVVVCCAVWRCCLFL